MIKEKLNEIILKTPTSEYREKLTVIAMLLEALEQDDKNAFNGILHNINFNKCLVCTEIGLHTAKEHNVSLDTIPLRPYSKMYENLLADTWLLMDAIADQPEGIFNDPNFANLTTISRTVIAINRLKKETGNVWPDAAGCSTFLERQDKYFNEMKENNK
jgi:hypothetical protein